MAGWGWLAGGRGKEVETVLSNIPLQGLYTKKKLITKIMHWLWQRKTKLVCLYEPPLLVIS